MLPIWVCIEGDPRGTPRNRQAARTGLLAGDAALRLQAGDGRAACAGETAGAGHRSGGNAHLVLCRANWCCPGSTMRGWPCGARFCSPIFITTRPARRTSCAFRRTGWSRSAHRWRFDPLRGREREQRCEGTASLGQGGKGGKARYLPSPSPWAAPVLRTAILRVRWSRLCFCPFPWPPPTAGGDFAEVARHWQRLLKAAAAGVAGRAVPHETLADIGAPVTPAPPKQPRRLDRDQGLRPRAA